MATTSRRSAIPQPVKGQDNVEVMNSLKENVEVLTAQRGDRAYSAVTWQDLVDLEIITPEQIPKR